MGSTIAGRNPQLDMPLSVGPLLANPCFPMTGPGFFVVVGPDNVGFRRRARDEAVSRRARREFPAARAALAPVG
jgi:hypothetical protein